MRPLSKLEVVHGGLVALAMLATTIAWGIPATPGAIARQLVVVATFGFVAWIALRFFARRSGSALHAPLSDAAGRRILGTALRAPFWLTAIALAVVVTLAWLKSKGIT